MRWHAVTMVIAAAVSVSAAAAAPAPSGTTVELERLSFALPAGWQQVPPSSQNARRAGGDPRSRWSGGDGGVSLRRRPGRRRRSESAALARSGRARRRQRTAARDVRERRPAHHLGRRAAARCKPGQMGMGPSRSAAELAPARRRHRGRRRPVVLQGDRPRRRRSAPQREAFVEMLRSARPRG